MAVDSAVAVDLSLGRALQSRSIWPRPRRTADARLRSMAARRSVAGGTAPRRTRGVPRQPGARPWGRARPLPSADTFALTTRRLCRARSAPLSVGPATPRRPSTLKGLSSARLASRRRGTCARGGAGLGKIAPPSSPTSTVRSPGRWGGATTTTPQVEVFGLDAGDVVTAAVSILSPFKTSCGDRHRLRLSLRLLSRCLTRPRIQPCYMQQSTDPDQNRCRLA